MAAGRHRQGLSGAPTDPKDLAAELRQAGRRVALVPGDLEEASTPQAVIRKAIDQLGSLGALVMCHAFQTRFTILDTTVKSFDRHYAVNIRASWLQI